MNEGRVCPTCKAELPADAEFCPHDGSQLGVGPPTGARTALFYQPPERGEVLLGRYRAIRSRSGREGAGKGAGEFIEARDMEEGRVVLVQVYPSPRGEGSAVRRQAMRASAERLLTLDLPGAIPVLHTAEDEDKRLVVVSKGAIGFTLAEILQHTGPFAPGRAVRIGADIADVLQRAHREKGVLHLDLRPECVFLVREADYEHAVVGGWRLGSEPEPNPALVPIPEEAAGDTPDERSDVFLIGALLYRLLTGTFGPEAPSTAAPPGTDIPWDLESLVMRAISPDPRARPQSAGKLCSLLQDCRCYGSWTQNEVEQSWAVLPIHDMTGVDGTSMTTLKRPTPPRTVLWIAAALLVALLLGIRFMSGDPPEEPEARTIIAPRTATTDPEHPPGPKVDATPDASEQVASAPGEPAPKKRKKRPKPAKLASAASAFAPVAEPAPKARPAPSKPPPLRAVEGFKPAMGDPPMGHPAYDHLQRGRALYRSGRYGGSLKELDRAYAIAPLPAILRDMAQTYAALNDTPKALLYFGKYRRKTKISKMESRAIDRLIEHLKAQDREPAAAERTDDQAPRVPFGKSAKNPSALYRAGALSYDAGDFETALARFKDAYAISPATELEYNIGLTLEQLGKPAKAIRWLERFRDRPGVGSARRKDISDRIQHLRGREDTGGGD